MTLDDDYDLQYWSKKIKTAESKILPENYVALKTHLKTLTDNGRKPRTIINQMAVLIQFAECCTKDFSSLNEFDIDDYFKSLNYNKSTLHLHKSTIKTFLSKINPVAADTIKSKKVKNKLAPADLLTMEEIDKLIEAAGSARDQALIACLYDSGARKGELLSTTIEDAKFDNNGCKLWLREGKTGARPARLTFASSYLKRWLEEHPLRKDPHAPIFCSNRPPHKVISRSGFYHRVVDIHILSGITKRTNPHNIRHMRATELAKKLNGSEQKLKAVLGWTADSQQASTYIHLSGQDIDDVMLEVAGIKKEDEPEKPSTYRCPRCREMNAITQTRCWKCGFSENDKVIDQEEIEKNVFEKLLCMMQEKQVEQDVKYKLTKD